MIEVRVRYAKRKPLAILSLSSGGASGYDLYASLDQAVRLPPLGRELIPCGIQLEIPDGYEAQIRPRSGLALESGLTILNSPGTIDSDYRGEIQVLMINQGSTPFTILPNMRVAQLVFCRVEHPMFLLVDELSMTKRGENGFGSTGI